MFRAIFSLFLICVTASAADEYEVRMTRPSKVGQRILITGSYQGSDSLEAKANGNAVRNDENSMEIVFESEQEAMEVTRAGKTSRVRVKLVKLNGKYNGAPISELKAGDVIESGPAGARDKFTVNGEPATQQQDKIARNIISTSREGVATDDEVFGPGRKIKVGDEWPINPEAAAKQGAIEGIPGFKPEDLKGTVKFTEITQIGGKPHMHLRAAIDMTGSGMAVPTAPPGVKVDQMVASFQMDGDFPIEATELVPAMEMKMAMRMDASGDLERTGQKVRLSVSGKFMKQRKARAKLLP